MVDDNARVGDSAVLGDTPDFVKGEKKDSVSGKGDTFFSLHQPMKFLEHCRYPKCFEIWIVHELGVFLLKFLGIPTPRNPHYQALVISLVWPAPLSYPVTEYLASQEYNRDIPLATTIQK